MFGLYQTKESSTRNGLPIIGKLCARKPFDSKLKTQGQFRWIDPLQDVPFHDCGYVPLNKHPPRPAKQPHPEHLPSENVNPSIFVFLPASFSGIRDQTHLFRSTDKPVLDPEE